MVKQDSGSVPGPAKQIDRLIMPLFALLLMLGIVSFVSIFADHSGNNMYSMTGNAVGRASFDMPQYYEKPEPLPRLELEKIGPDVVAEGTPVLVNMYGKHFKSPDAQVMVNIYDLPYFGRQLVMRFKTAVHTDNHASFGLPDNLPPGDYFISVGEGKRESLRQQIRVK